MNQHLQSILLLVQESDALTLEQKLAISKSLKDADKELEITAFKLDRTEKVKRTTAILLEETIQELEQKRKAVEIQNRELEIEAALERIRAKALAMQKSLDLLSVANELREQMRILGQPELESSLIHLYQDPKEAAEKANVLYTDTWVSMGQEAEEEVRKQAFKGFQINSDFLKSAKDDVKVMHCLPAHRGEEITDEVIDGPHSIVYDQAENRLHVEKALLKLLLRK